ncbi:MAG: DUF3685 domain-containing protein [Chloroflexaceae bacterium]|nr:DUF3685 domain-containing protein [Chloroflexaceae bacterium]
MFEETSPVILTLLEKTLEKIRLGVKNGTNILLEIDILRNAKKRELLYLVLNRFNTTLEEWRFLEISPAELPQRLPLALQEIWQVAALDFLGRNLNRSSGLSGDRETEWANLLLQNAGSIQGEILAKIPLQEALFAYFLWERPLEIGKVFYPLGASDRLDQGELLLQNLLITVANAVTQVILNQFWQSESLKQVLYDEPWLSAREIARFRNELSWRYRLETYWQDPKNIFESRYRLFFLDGDSIRTAYIYAPRQGELQQLQGLPWLTTLALEARDAIAPRLQSLVDWAGRGIVYILTEVIGKAIGLIGRGIILGIGNVFQESRYRNPRQQEREF